MLESDPRAFDDSQSRRIVFKCHDKSAERQVGKTQEKHCRRKQKRIQRQAFFNRSFYVHDDLRLVKRLSLSFNYIKTWKFALVKFFF